MVEILRNQNLATRFQILVEIASRSPNVQQRDIAKKLGITPQAVSDYVKQLVKEGLLSSEGRSKYRVTASGVNWVIKVLRELRNYHTLVEKSITNISVCAAVAEGDLAEGQAVGLKMKSGLLFATRKVGRGARGIALSDAKAGEDVGVTDIDGIVGFEVGKVTILEVPGIEEGGSRLVDTSRLSNNVIDRQLVGAIGIEAMVALKRVGIKYACNYGVVEAAVEATNSGLNPAIICVGNETSNLIKRLTEGNIAYEIIYLKKEENNTL